MVQRKVAARYGLPASCGSVPVSAGRRRRLRANSGSDAKDIHRSGGKLLDKTGLTSRICSGSLHRCSIDDFVSKPKWRNATMSSSDYRSVPKKNDKAATEAIAKDTDTDVERVEEIYEQ